MVRRRSPLPPRVRLSSRLRRTAAAAAALTAVLLAAPPAAAEPLTVVELFTSQGCSACPPADALVGELAARGDVLALSEHVDYWDYLGWKDPFASAAHTGRQRAYARSLGLKYVYTPQIVVQGTTQVAGADRAAVLQSIAHAAPPPADLSVGWAGRGRLLIRLEPAPDTRPTDLWLVLFERQRSTPIASGENKGRQVVNHHVVREFRRIPAWSGAAGEIAVDLPPADWSALGCAVILQVRDGGPVLGAARCAPPPD